MLAAADAARRRKGEIVLTRRARPGGARLPPDRLHSHHARNPFARQRQAVSRAGQPRRRYPGGLFTDRRCRLSVEGGAARPQESFQYRQQRADAASERGACALVDCAGSIEGKLQAAAEGVAAVISSDMAEIEGDSALEFAIQFAMIGLDSLARCLGNGG